MWPRQKLTHSNWKSWWTSNEGGKRGANSRVFQVWQFYLLGRSRGVPRVRRLVFRLQQLRHGSYLPREISWRALSAGQWEDPWQSLHCSAPPPPFLSLELILSWIFRQRCKLKVFKVVYSAQTHNAVCIQLSRKDHWGHMGQKQGWWVNPAQLFWTSFSWSLSWPLDLQHQRESYPCKCFCLIWSACSASASPPSSLSIFRIYPPQRSFSHGALSANSLSFLSTLRCLRLD